MTTTPQPGAETPARPSVTLQTGRYYPEGGVNWLTPEVVAAANCPADRTIRVTSMNFEGYRSPHYGIHAPGNGTFTAYPIKPGTYQLDVHMDFDLKDPDTPSDTTDGATVVVDLVVTGEALGTEYDREVLHHLHPDIPAQDTRITTAQTAAETAQTAADAAQKRADAAMADSGFNKETNDSQGNAIGQLTQRVLALEMEEAREATEEGEDTGD